jgi:hypothetical protein
MDREGRRAAEASVDVPFTEKTERLVLPRVARQTRLMQARCDKTRRGGALCSCASCIGELRPGGPRRGQGGSYLRLACGCGRVGRWWCCRVSSDGSGGGLDDACLLGTSDGAVDEVVDGAPASRIRLRRALRGVEHETRPASSCGESGCCGRAAAAMGAVVTAAQALVRRVCAWSGGKGGTADDTTAGRLGGCGRR